MSDPTTMRRKYSLWRCSNGWLLVPETTNTTVYDTDASDCAVFKSLKEFAEQYPKAETKPKTKKTYANNHISKRGQG